MVGASAKREGNHADIASAGFDELGGLRDVLAEDQSVFDLIVDFEVFHRRDGGPSIRGMFRIGDGNFFDCGIAKESIPLATSCRDSRSVQRTIRPTA